MMNVIIIVCHLCNLFLIPQDKHLLSAVINVVIIGCMPSVA